MKANNLTEHLPRLPHRWLWLLITVAVLFLLFLLASSAVAIVQLTYRDRFWPTVRIASVDVGGKNYAEGLAQVRAKIDSLRSQGFSYSSSEKSVTLYPTAQAAADPDVSRDLIDWQIEPTVNAAWQVGRNINFLTAWQLLPYTLKEKYLPMQYRWDETEYGNILQQSFQDVLPGKKEPQLYFANDQPKLSGEASGLGFNYTKAISQTQDRIAKLDNQPIKLDQQIENPTFSRADLMPLLPEVERALNFATWEITYNDQSYTISPRIMRDWLGFEQGKNKQPILAITEQGWSGWLDKIRPEIEQSAQNAKMQIENGRAVEFQPSQNGVAIDTVKMLQELNDNLYQHNNLELAVMVTKPDYDVSTVNDIGIKEILGTGISDFSGSPVNRRHNIKVGADSLNGIIISPDEEFSLLKALGQIDASTGYRQELVIKGDRTIPEFGGGLCQIGTTTFRAALASGLPITERRNHSYRVRYYEPAGKDATIYDPAPDFRFLNDTGHNILIQTRIDGDKLYFDFWGTSDGRKIEQSDSIIYNIVPSGETKYVETTELPVGDKKCTESAHAGADAKFDYNVTYADGTEKKTTFASHYVPWQAVCLIGVIATSTPALPEGPSTGDVIISNSLN